MRIACLWVPDLPLVATLRAEPHLARLPLAVVQAGSDLAEARSSATGAGRTRGASKMMRHVLACTPAAEGVSRGQTLAEARAICPGLQIRALSPERVRAAAQAALEAAGALSPRLEEKEPGLIHLDVEGLERLIGDERMVARELVRAAERVGLCAAVGLAQGKRVASLAARAALPDLALEVTSQGLSGGAFRVVPQGEERAFLEALPLLALADLISDELLHGLHRFGLHTLGEVARLAPGPLAARLGPEVAALHRLARGEDQGALVPQPLPERFEEGEELEWGLSTLEPLLFVWKALLDRLAQRLILRGLMAQELLLQLQLEGGGWDERRIDLAGPTREVASLLQLLRLHFEGQPPESPVRAVRLCVVPTREVLEQLPLFGPRGASATQLAAAVARLSALVGPGRVGRPVAPDSHRPFAARMEKFAPPPPPILPEPVQAQLSLAARALRPPRHAEVRCDGQGRPTLVISEGTLADGSATVRAANGNRRFGEDAGRLPGGRVVGVSGPWRTLAEWWTSAPISLDAYDLELSDGLLIRASRETASGAWWIEAIYD